jgi:DNA-binding NarL/FixJ family response regulator
VNAKTRVAVVDDHPIILTGLREIIQSAGDLELIGEATSGLAALKLIRENQPDVAVIDISLPDLNGIALSRRLAEECPSVRVLILTFHEDRAYMNQAFQTGVSGYLLKRSAAENLVPAIRSVSASAIFIDSAIAGRVLEPRGARTKGTYTHGEVRDLTDRETEVLKFVALGFTSKEIARQLDLGVKSVDTYRARGAEKLDLKTRAEIVRYAAARGWLAGI